MGILVNKRLILFIFCSLSLFANANDLLVVSSKMSPVELSRQQIKQVYLGARLSVDGVNIQPLALPVGVRWRSVFNSKVIGLSEARIQSYWAQMRFTGRRTEPTEMDNTEKLIEQLKQQPGALGYLPSHLVDANLFHIIYRVPLD
ncbi:hypothetical protein [Catenovulum adriaticum]|uniref:Uncharacterized protein n=1 Tax=Catenovulum adriaticum TaxID=2984846 RepID=A0ABY7AKI8_9ALTE|nr:hypothetical protein [Catenovulum sp. TS8]WAJ69267.1 hypothetical protein OLW01_08715 [Catenovulum sp. TS8]